ncbi:Cystathionine beta-lyase PatB [Collinsella sp. AK_207A]|uniref:MalY/PatB family protein n=1 Tax=Collinsella sp. AK_207A TaxID=2650472 RepID=UPI001260F327|nr:aminotransferase class I/II-fold pyridoxal phosphate-dependent enzyme [Collinsella sp. AK_207A]VWL92118.1 Cystathionine beta-lyase PatB [Collinsella sp. AK_207A]
MKYDFTSKLERVGFDAEAVESVGKRTGLAPEAPKPGFDLIPMWVADMNFPCVPTVQQALIQRVEHPAFGYFKPREEYFAKIIEWQRRHNGVTDLEPQHIGYENGVLGGLVSTLQSFCAPGDKVLVHSPTYIGFTNSVTNAGFRLVHSPLKIEDGVWRMDFADMECKLSEQHIHAAIFCSPHNPSGRVWERWEIERAMELFRRYDCVVISDEIWSDLIRPGFKHVPTQSVSEDARNRTVALYAPSKTFNLAGLVGAYHIIYNDHLRDRVQSVASKCQYNEMNVLSMHALLGAYEPEGYEWVDELNQVIAGNVDFARAYMAEHFEGVTSCLPQGTYMLFVDCSGWCQAHGKTIEDVEHAAWNVGVAVQDGRMFLGRCHLRMNLALPFSRVQEAFERLDRYVFNA